MSMARLTVLEAGPLTSVQGSPRQGFMRFGVPPSGPIDRIAHAAANLAIGREAVAAGIEISLGGLTLHCDEGRLDFALCGGDFAASCDENAIGSWTTGRIAAGQRLRIVQGEQGNWAYLALAGQLVAPQWLGSASTHLIAGLGGGRLLPGHTLVITAEAGARAQGPIPRPNPARTARTELRVVLGPQQRFFSERDLQALAAEAFRPSLRFDRMGMLLDGPILQPLSIAMISEPAVRGALQVDGSGRTVMLLADHQTTAGYPKVATVLGCDTESVAQANPGTPLRFLPVEPEQAIAIARETAQEDRAYLGEIAKGPVDFATRLWTANLVSGVQHANEG